ncbi:MAG: hypothetical protein JOZ37_01175 [Actinobacteria bacterium]|nr:hypothetical protein [Actinomycetota bacterium]MBV9253149.1 hypothetical protein [Actinomycetota bacterium]MBV9662546.1 hypothetical protein [Actinomycetota bacterium]MBV9936654.1 hypothetical protein [Actinomycetota bacterium]
MPPILRSRLALAALLGVFLIPIGMSSLRGLTHVLTCREHTNVPFSVDIPTITSSQRITRNEPLQLCGGLSLNLAVKSLSVDKVQVRLPITNNTKYTWQGSVSLKVSGTSIPVRVGEVKPGRTVVNNIDVKVAKGTDTIDGSLLIGP